jgi:hypothetical protein
MTILDTSTNFMTILLRAKIALGVPGEAFSLSGVEHVTARGD